MTTTTTAALDSPTHGYSVSESYPYPTCAVSSAVSWGAIAAGAAAGAALSLILLILGVGLGLSSVSPWSFEGISASSFGLSTIIWLMVTQLLSSAIGGYLAGRLRTKWIATHTDEVYFRDTAHGFLSWAVASLATVAVLTSAIGSILSGSMQAGASAASGVANAASAAAASWQGTSAENGPMAYFVDALFRHTGTNEAGSSAGPAMPADTIDRATNKDAAEVRRIFSNVSRTEPLPSDDLQYVGQLVAQRTGLPQQDAEKRVSNIYARAQARVNDAELAAKQAADVARKALAHAALWIFVSLLCGAFVASLSATYGGRQRDA